MMTMLMPQIPTQWPLVEAIWLNSWTQLLVSLSIRKYEPSLKKVKHQLKNAKHIKKPFEVHRVSVSRQKHVLAWRDTIRSLGEFPMFFWPQEGHAMGARSGVGGPTAVVQIAGQCHRIQRSAMEIHPVERMDVVGLSTSYNWDKHG